MREISVDRVLRRLIANTNLRRLHFRSDDVAVTLSSNNKTFVNNLFDLIDLIF